MGDKAMKNMLAVIVMVGIAIGVSTSLWVSSKQTKLSVPTALSTLSDGRVVVVTRKDLLLVSDVGELIKTYPLSGQGINETVVDLQSLPDGSLLLAESRDGVVYRCQLDGFSCSPFIRPVSGSIDPQANSVKLAADDAAGIIYLSNPWKQAIEQYDFEGKLLGTLHVDAQGLLYPNDMWVLPGGRLAIADSNHRRIAVSEPKSTKAYGVKLASFPVRNYPVSVLFEDGKWWVIGMSEMAASGVLSVYDSKGKQLKRVALGQQAFPVALEPIGSSLFLVAIQSPAHLMVIDANGKDAGWFEGRGLANYFESVRAQQQWLDHVLHSAWAGLALCGLLALFVVYLEYRGKSRMNEPLAVEYQRARTLAQQVQGQVEWLVAEGQKKQLREIVMLFVLMLIGLGLVAFDGDGGLRMAPTVGILLGVMLLTLWLLWGQRKALAGSRIGIEGETIWLDDGAGKIVNAPAGEVFHSNMALAYADVAVIYRTSMHEMFSQKVLRAKVFPLLDHGKSLKRSEMGKYLQRIKHPLIGHFYKVLIVLTLLVLGLAYWSQSLNQ